VEAPEGDLEVVVQIVTDDEALEFHVEARGRGRSRTRIGARRHAQFSEHADLGRQRRAHVQRELTFLESRTRAQQRLRAESGGGAMRIRGSEIEIAESRYFERRIGCLRIGRRRRIVIVRGLLRRRRRRRSLRRHGAHARILQLRHAFLQRVDARQQPFDEFFGRRIRRLRARPLRQCQTANCLEFIPLPQRSQVRIGRE
jgi:hypothetical protein